MLLLSIAPAQDRRVTLVSPGPRRLALVIGNNAYVNQALRNPVNDAEAVKSALSDVGFEVQMRLNVTMAQMEDIANRFVSGVRPGDVAVFYYSGHGIQVGGENYLIPVDFDARTAVDAKYKSYAASRMQENLEAAGAGLQILILDACRDNPYRSVRSAGGGLAPMQAGKGTYIAFATAPGKTADDNAAGRNGLFTGALLKALREPGLTLDQVFNRVREEVTALRADQVPWSASSVVGEFYFHPGSAASPSTIPNPAPKQDAAAEAWNLIKDSKDAEDFEQYASAFPNSDLAAAARFRAAQLRRAKTGGAGAVIDSPAARPSGTALPPPAPIVHPLAQVTTLEGTVTGVNGKPVPAAIVKIHRTDIKWDAQIKTDKRGHYIHSGVPAGGSYEISVLIDGKEMDRLGNVKSPMGDRPPTDFDLRKTVAQNNNKNEMVKQAMETGRVSDDLKKQLTTEQMAALEKSMAENKGKIQKQKALNDAFNEGLTALQAAPHETTPEGKATQYQTAVTALQKAGEVDATQPAVWSNLGDAYLGLAGTKTGADFDDATAKGIAAYGKAIELKPDDPATHNNYGLALAKAKKYPEAEAELKKAADLDPPTAFQRYYNLGALLSNIGQSEPASKAFKAAIDSAPDNPKNAESYYQYGLSLAAQATVDKDGKFVAPPGTIESFQKYLEFAPNGPNAQYAKDMITQLGGSIQTEFKNPNAQKKKK